MAMKRKNLPELAPQVFDHEQFGSVRVVMIDNEPYFVGIDVAKALGYKRERDALKEHVPDKFKLTRQITASGQRRNVTLINEHGMYRLVLRSKLPSAEKFTDWACDVLVSIRKTGSYSVAQYDFFHPSLEELERRSKITTIEGMIEDLEAHGIDLDWELRPRIEIDENGVEHVVYRCELVINHPEYEKLKKRIAAQSSDRLLPV